MRKTNLRYAAALAVLSACRVQAQPAEAPDQAAQVYEAAYYARFSPRTALDMIRQTPGFTLEETGTRRGFSAAAGNVLVDGERPIAKSQTLSDILQRIPATQVLRIEVLRGREAATDASGHVVLANVVRTPSAGQGVYQLGYEYAGRTPVPNGWASWSGRLGRTDYSLGVNGYSLMRNLPGERVQLDGSGHLTGTRKDASPRDFYEVAVNAEASRPLLGGQVRATGQVQFERYHEDSVIATFSPSGAPTESETNPYTFRNRVIEGGLNYDLRLGGWDFALAGLVTRTRFSSDVSSTKSRPPSIVASIFTQAIERDSGETIVRATLSRPLGTNHRLEIGAEGALNTLDQRLAATYDGGGGPVVIPILNSNLSVEERRGEAYLLHSWTPGRWSVETRLAGEISRLSFTGDANQSVSLAYFKPSFQVTRRIGRRNQIRARLYRDVGQLDFTDFVSAASFADDRINGGNPDLRPETSWRAELAGDLRFGADGAAGLTLFHYWISDTADLVPVGPPNARIDAPGNIGDATVDGAQLTLRLPLKPVLPGASLTVDGTWRRSRVTDPLTRERRAISGLADRAFKADFRHDLPGSKLAWGASYVAQPTLVYYRLQEIERKRASPSLDLWVETTALDRVKVRLTVLSLLGQSERRERTLFAPDRTGAIDSIERGERHPGRWLTLAVSGSF